MNSRILFFIIAASFLWGCNEKGGNDASSEKPKQGGTLNIALISDIDSFNPIVSSSDVVTTSIQDLLFPALTSIYWNDSIGCVEYKPLLASSWEIIPSQNCVKFNLRDDARWSNGASLGLMDVIYSYHLYSHPLSASPNGFLFDFLYRNGDSGIDTFRSVTKINDYSFAVHFASEVRNPMHFSILKIVPANYYGKDLKKLREDPNNFKPLSAGPYQLESWNQDQKIVLVRNNKYTLGDKPYIDKLVFKIFPDYTSRLAALKTGDIDFMEGVRSEDIKSFAGSDIETRVLNGRNYEFVCWNNIDGGLYRKTGQIKPNVFFGSKIVRRALTMAIDREEIIDGFLGEYGKICNGPISPVFKWAYNASIQAVEFNRHKAEQLLAQDGWIDHNNNGIIDKNGKEFIFSLYINAGNPRREFAAIMIKNYLKKIGIEVKIEKLEWNLFDTKIYNRELDAFINGIAVSSDINPYEFWYSDFRKAPMNDPGFQNKRVDEIIDIAAKLNRNDAAPYWKEFQEIIHEEQPCTFLYWYANVIGYNKKIRNLQSDIWDSYNQISSWWLSN